MTTRLDGLHAGSLHERHAAAIHLVPAAADSRASDSPDSASAALLTSPSSFRRQPRSRRTRCSCVQAAGKRGGVANRFVDLEAAGCNRRTLSRKTQRRASRAARRSPAATSTSPARRAGRRVEYLAGERSWRDAVAPDVGFRQKWHLCPSKRQRRIGCPTASFLVGTKSPL